MTDDLTRSTGKSTPKPPAGWATVAGSHGGPVFFTDAAPGPISRRVPIGFGFALIMIVALGLVTQSNISQLVSATAATSRSVHALERLQALKAAVREIESSELGFVLGGHREYQDAYQAASAEVARVRRELEGLLETPAQLAHLRRLTALVDAGAPVFRRDPAARPGPGGAPATFDVRRSPAPRSGEMDAAIDAMERDERAVLAGREAQASASARTARWNVFIAGVLAFTTILIAALMVRRDVLERRKATDRLQRANTTLAEAVAEAQRHRDEITRLARLSHFLQGSRSMEEAFAVIEKSAPALFGGGGALYLTQGERLERAAAWDAGYELLPAFAQEACWAIRQGTIHETDGASTVPGCRHLPGGASATCVPMISDTGAFGLLVLAKRAHTDDRAVAPATLLAAFEQISAGLANLRLRESLKIQSLRDELTGLYNRRFLHDALSRECHDARRHPERPVALLLLDLDYFKRVNDTSGHAAGDALLQALAELLGRTFRGGDLACRYGGEEFAIVLTETPLDVAVRRAEALRVAIRGLHARHGGVVLEGLTVSIGVTAGAGVGLSPEQLLLEADTALYQAKGRGRDCCVAYHETPEIPRLRLGEAPSEMT